MANNADKKIKVIRFGKEELIDSKDLVQGDCVKLENINILPCDFVII